MFELKGIPCGNSFISPRLTCHKGAKKFLDKIKKNPPNRFPSSADQKRRVVTALEKAKNKKEQRDIMRDVTNRLSPEQAQDILDRKMPNGMTFEEYADKRGSDNYNIPGQKQRADVTDAEVDHFWDSLSTLERNLLVPAGAGAPDREKKNNGGKSLVDTDWGTKPEDRIRMRKAMLKTLLEQLDDNGNLIDPWTGKAFDIPADLDHIRPVAKGGGHGIAEKGKPKPKSITGTDYNSENWIWTSKEINRNYKGDRDIKGTVARIKAATDENRYNKGLDEKIDQYLTVEKEKIQLEDNTAKAAREAFSGSGHGINSFPNETIIMGMDKEKLESVMKGLESADPSLQDITKNLFSKSGVSDDERRRAVAEAVKLTKDNGRAAISTIKSNIASLTGTPFTSVAVSPSITLPDGKEIKTPRLDAMMRDSSITINDLDDDSYVNLMFQLYEQEVIDFKPDGTAIRGKKGGVKGKQGGFRDDSIQVLNSTRRQPYTDYIKQDRDNPDRPKRSKGRIRPLENHVINEIGLKNLPSYDNITPIQAHNVTNDIRSMTGYPRLRHNLSES